MFENPGCGRGYAYMADRFLTGFSGTGFSLTGFYRQPDFDRILTAV
jgi:hypothetical protein